MKKYDLTKANRQKKKERIEAKKGLRPYFQVVTRVPNEKGKKAYTKLVTSDKASILIHGRPKVDYDGSVKMVKLSREFV